MGFSLHAMPLSSSYILNNILNNLFIYKINFFSTRLFKVIKQYNKSCLL